MKMSGVFDRNRKKDMPGDGKNGNLEQYLLNSTLHGLRYVGDKKISYFERYTNANGMF